MAIKESLSSGWSRHGVDISQTNQWPCSNTTQLKTLSISNPRILRKWGWKKWYQYGSVGGITEKKNQLNIILEQSFQSEMKTRIIYKVNDDKSYHFESLRKD